MRLNSWLTNLYRQLANSKFSSGVRRRPQRSLQVSSVVESLEHRRMLSPAGASNLQLITETLEPGKPITSVITPPTGGASQGQTSHQGAPASQGAGLIINATFDSTITNDPNAATIEATINKVIAEYQASFTDKITVNITFQEMNSGLGQSSSFISSLPYTAIRDALVSTATTSDDATALAHLPATATDPVLGRNNVIVRTANQKALGFNPGNPTDGIIGLNTSICNLDRTTIAPNKYDLAAVAAHEMDEVLGFGSSVGITGDISMQDLYRYAPNGTRSYAVGTSVQAFFSLDGVTDLVQFNQSGGGADYGDWASSATHRVQDAFGSPGTTSDPGVEYIGLDVQGYHFVAPPTDIALSNTQIPETDPIGTVVGDFSSTEGGLIANTFTYSLVPGAGSTDNGSFTINTNGQLVTNSLFNFHTQNSYSIRVRTTDENNNTFDKVFTLQVLAEAKTLTVDILGDVSQVGHTTLRDAVAEADFDNIGDTIVFANSINGGTITLTQGELLLNAPMTIQGPGSGLMTISGGGNSRIFDVDDSNNGTAVPITISGLKLTLGNGAGANNTGFGGAIYNTESLTLSNDVLIANSATNDGGGVDNDGTISSSNVTYANNFSAGDGGGFKNFGTLISYDDTFSSNSAIIKGGGIENAGSFTATNDTFYGNLANIGGGISNLGTMITTNVTIAANSATTSASGVYNSSGTWKVLNSIVAGNTLNSGGNSPYDIQNVGGTLTAKFTLVGDASTSAGILDGTNGNIVGKAVTAIFLTDSNGIPQLGDHGGVTQTTALKGGSPAKGTGTALTTLSSSIPSGATSLVVADGTYIEVGDSLRIDSEIFAVTAVSGNNITVVPGQNNTSSASHATNATVNLAIDQNGVSSFSNDLGSVKSTANNPPLGVSNTITIVEDNSYTFKTADFGFADSSDIPANTLFAVKISSLPLKGVLKDNGTPVIAGQFVSATDISGNHLTFTPAANGNGTNYASFQFQVQDNGGTTAGGVDTDTVPKSMTFNVISVNDAPTGASTTVTTLEDTAYTLKTADFGFSDSSDNPANLFVAAKIATLPVKGTLKDNGVAVTAGQSISATDIASNKLVFTPAANQNGAAYANFKFQVQDNGGTVTGGADTDPLAKTLTVNVTSVNDAPAGKSATVTTLESISYAFKLTDFGFTDPSDSPANTLQAVKIATLPGTGVLKDNGTIVTPGQFISAADIGGNQFTFTPVTGTSGTNYANFTFQVQDNGGTSNSGVNTDPFVKTMMINVLNVNNAPTGAANTVTTLEDTTYTFQTGDFGFSDTNDNPANLLLAVKIATLPVKGSLSDNGVSVTTGQFVSATDIANHKLVFTPQPDANGSGYAGFTFQVQDDGGTANGGADTDLIAKSMNINVTSVNDAPLGTSGTVTTLSNSTYQLKTSDFGFSDPNDSPANSLFAVKFTLLPTAGTLALSGVPLTANQSVSASDISLGNLVFTPNTNLFGGPFFLAKFQVQDNAGVANGGIDLDPTAKVLYANILRLNHAPQGATNTVSTSQGVAYTLQTADFGFSDPNDTPPNALLAVKVTLVTTSGSLTDNGVAVTANQSVSVADISSGKLVYTPNANSIGGPFFICKFQVQDNGGTANGGVDLDPNAKVLNISIAHLNHAPAGTSNTVSTFENTSYALKVSDFGFTDPNDSPANSLKAVKFTLLPTSSGTLTDNGLVVTANQSISLSDISSGKLVFTPVSNLSGGPFFLSKFQVQDNGGTAGGGVDLDPTQKTLYVNIAQVNQAPTGRSGSVTTPPNTALTLTLSNFGFSDPNNSPPNSLLALKISNVSLSGSLTDNGVAVVSGSTVSGADILAGKFKYLPPPNATGVMLGSFMFQVQDNGGTANGGSDTDPTVRTMTISVGT